MALAIHTPLGVLIHTGDFKVDPTPTDNRLFDLHAFAEYGKQGVLALFQDSTNVEREGYTPSERAVRARFDEIFARTKRRLFISCFSSSIHRIKLTMETGVRARTQGGARRPLDDGVGGNRRKTWATSMFPKAC